MERTIASIRLLGLGKERDDPCQLILQFVEGGPGSLEVDSSAHGFELRGESIGNCGTDGAQGALQTMGRTLKLGHIIVADCLPKCSYVSGIVLVIYLDHVGGRAGRGSGVFQRCVVHPRWDWPVTSSEGTDFLPRALANSVPAASRIPVACKRISHTRIDGLDMAKA
jgi:hypothetical protein